MGLSCCGSGSPLAYQMFQSRFVSPRWRRLAEAGARVQRPLWASTSTKNSDTPIPKYVDAHIGPDTVTTLTENTIDRFEHHGTGSRTIDRATRAADTLTRLQGAVIDLDEVGEYSRATASRISRPISKRPSTPSKRPSH